jgi:TolB-like protein/Tfp pilus assembly protein PilF
MKETDRMVSNERIRFGPFQIDLATGELRRSNERVKLAPQPSKLLLLLTDRAGQLVTREDIQQRLWGTDTFVDFEQGLNFSIRQIRTALGDDADDPQFIETVPRRGYRFIAPIEKSSESLAGSLAVLPFENTGEDSGSQFLVDGLTESIVYRLARIPELRVVPRSTVFRYRGTDREAHDIGRELQVRAVVTGRVQQSGDDLILAVELIDVDKRSQTWGERYRRKLTDIFEMQENIAHQICEKLQIELSASAQNRLRKRETQSIEAYQLFLKGQFFWNKRTEQAIKKAIGYFNEAIQRDPGYALAYAAIADAYIPLAYYTYLSPADAFPKARSAAVKALAIDETLADAHGVLGTVAWLHEGRALNAEREFQLAIGSSPNVPRLRQIYAEFLASLARFDEAHREMDKALELDALSVPLNYVAGLPYYYRRDYGKAIECCRKALELDPEFYPAHHLLGLAYLQEGRYSDALSELQEANRISLATPYVLGALGTAYALAGKSEEATDVLNQLQLNAPQRYVSPYFISIILAGLGQLDSALEHLYAAHTLGCCRMAWIGVDPLLDKLRHEPRFEALIQGVNLHA